MELELKKTWVNRHGKEFKIGTVIHFGRETGLKLIAEGVAVVKIKEEETASETEEEPAPSDNFIKLKAIKRFKMNGRSYKIGDSFVLSDDNSKVIEKLIEESKVQIIK